MSRQIGDRLGFRKTHSEGQYLILLRFDNSKINIGDIATGKVKTTIDNLYPVIGGVCGQPEDWRVNILLQVEKCSTGSGGAGVHISIWMLD